MDALQTAFSQHAFTFWLVLLLLVVLLAVWLLSVDVRRRRLETRFDDLFANTSSENMAPMLADYLGLVRNTATTVSRVKAEHDQIAALMPGVIRHVGLVRFSPFNDTGGDQSFALALLDGRGDGVIVSSLHSRAGSRLYAKPIEGGRSTYSLTPEEHEAMDRALNRTAMGAQSG